MDVETEMEKIQTSFGDFKTALENWRLALSGKDDKGIDKDDDTPSEWTSLSSIINSDGTLAKTLTDILDKWKKENDPQNIEKTVSARKPL